MIKENLEIRTGTVNVVALDESRKEFKEYKEFNPQYRILEKYFDSLKCRCSCNPGPPGPYCRQDS